MLPKTLTDGRSSPATAILRPGVEEPPDRSLGGDRLCLRPDALRGGHRLTLHRDGAEAYPRMLEAIRGAGSSVLLEVYAFADDTTGRRFAEALGGRARAGVDVRVLYDAVGSHATDRAFFGGLRSQGVKVVEFQPLLRWFAGLGLGRRNHRKLLAVDGRTAFVGGLNVTREYAPVAEGGAGWRDTLVEIEGPCVSDLRDSFLELWTRGRPGDPPPDDDRPGPAAGDAAISIVGSQRLRERREIGRHYRHAIGQARERIWIASAYFLPSLRFARRLRAARRRGVDVRLLVPGRSDFGPVLYAVQRLFSSLLLAGIRIYEWRGPMMHAKAMVVDGTWSTIGSYNIDPLSALRNHELVAVVSDAEFGGSLEAMFEEDFARSREIKGEAWRNRGWWRRILERVAYRFRGRF